MNDLTRMNEERFDSPFYPPRARWWSGLLYPWFRFLRTLHLEHIHCPRGFSTVQTLLALLVPGVSFIGLGRRMLGFSIFWIYSVSVVVFIVRLGFAEGNFAYGLLLAAHATSVFYLLAHWLGNMEFINKLLLAAGSLFVVWMLLYVPVVHFFESRYAVPLRVSGEVVVMHPRVAPDKLRRGDRIMFRVEENAIGQAHGGGVVRVDAGIGWGPVLALPGETVLFFTNSFSVNGVTQANLAHMPTSGEFVVPTNRWFVWPDFGINARGNVSEANISALILQLSTVSTAQMTGRPFERWLGRKQKLP